METCHRPAPTLAARDDLLSSTVVEPPSLGSVMSGFSSQIESTISVLGLWDRQNGQSDQSDFSRRHTFGQDTDIS